MALDVVTTTNFSGSSVDIATIKVETTKNMQVAALADSTGAPITAANPANVTLATGLNSQDDAVQVLSIPGRASWVTKQADYSSSATAALWTPTGSTYFICTELFVEWSGATDGTITVWSSVSSSGDTTYTTGTDRLLFQYHATPSTKGTGAYHGNVFFPGFAVTYPLLVTRSSAIVCTVIASGYETA